MVFVLIYISLYLSSFAIILTRKRELVAHLLSSFLCLVNVLWLLLTVPWAGMQCVIVVFSDHTHIHFTEPSPWKGLLLQISTY